MRKVDVCIIGAGLAGLSAARYLRSHGKRVLVLESRHRCGGRTFSEKLSDGVVIEHGGQWIGSTQTAIIELAQQLGAEIFPSPAKGKRVLTFKGRKSVYSSVPWAFGFYGLLDLWRCIKKLDALAKTVPLDAPWLASRSAEWDSQSFGDWLAIHCKSDAAKFLFNRVALLNMGTEPNQLSLLYVLFKIHSAGGFVQLTDMKKGGLQFQFVKGSQDLCLRMAEELGEQLLLSSKVDRIEQTSEAAFVHTEKFSVMAAQVIVALDPVAAGQIHISSQQDEENVPAIPQWTLAKGSKIHCIYSRPFWRERNLSGNALWDSGPIRAVFDNSRPQSGRGVLVLFTDLFALNNKHLDQDERKSRVLEELVKVFGQEAALPMDYREKDWSLETTVGGCVANLRPGILTACGPSLRESNGRIHQVSAETALIWESHMEGAIRSGQAAGLRCLEMLTD